MLEIIYYKVPEPIEANRNYDYRPDGITIDTIVLHYTERDEEESYRILTTPHSVSSHYLIMRDGTIHCLVPENLMAHHAGISYWRGKERINENSIGIEIVNLGNEPYPSKQMEIVVALLLDIMTRYPNIKQRNIVGHSDVAPDRKIDPGKYFDWLYLNKQGIGYYPLGSVSQNNDTLYKTGDTGNGVMALETKLRDYGYKVKLDGIYDRDNEDVVRAFKLHFCPNSINLLQWDLHADRTLDTLLLMN